MLNFIFYNIYVIVQTFDTHCAKINLENLLKV